MKKSVQGLGMFLASSIWGSWVLIVSRLTLPGYFLTCMTCITGFIALIIYLAARNRIPLFLAVTRDSALLRVIVITSLFGTMSNVMIMIALQLAVASGGSALIPVIRSFSGIVMSLVVIAFSSHEAFSPRYLATGVISTAGALLIFLWGGLTIGDHVSYLSLLLIACSIVTMSFYSIYQKQMAVNMQRTGQTESSVIAWQALLTGLFCVPLILGYLIFNPANPPQPAELLYMAAFGVTHLALAYVLRLHALRVINAQQSVIIGYIEYVISIALSILFLKETVTPGFFIGTIMIIGSAVLASLQTNQPVSIALARKIKEA